MPVATIGTGRALIGVGRGFTPAQLPNLALWLNASAVTGKSDGDAMATWADQSGNGRNATQATGTKQPLYKTNIVNGKPVLRFDSTDDCLTASAIDLTGTPAVSLFVVTATIGSATDRVVFETSSNFNANVGSFILFRDTSNKVNVDVKGNTVGASQCIGTTSVTSAATVLTGVYDMSLSALLEAQLYVNGTAEGSHTGSVENTANFGTHAINIGSRNNGASLPLGGDIAEIILYSRALSTAERQQVERYLGAKYGITVA